MVKTAILMAERAGLSFLVAPSRSHCTSRGQQRASGPFPLREEVTTRHPSLSWADNHDCSIYGADLSQPPSADVCFCVNNVRRNNREAMSR